jgi:hypothetical protein
VRFSGNMGFCHYFGCVFGYFWGAKVLRRGGGMGNWPGVRVMVRAFVWQGVKMGVRVLWSWGYVSIWLIKIVSDCFL